MTNHNCKKRVLLVEDEETLAENLGAFLESLGAEVAIAHSGEQAIRAADLLGPQCVVMDYNLPGMNGLQTIDRIWERHPQARCVLITAQCSEAITMEALERGIQQVLLKPFPLPELRTQVCGGSREHPCEDCRGEPDGFAVRFSPLVTG